MFKPSSGSNCGQQLVGRGVTAASALKQVVFGIALLLAAGPLQATWHQASEDIMGTRVHAEVWIEDAQLAKLALRAVMSEMRAVDDSMSPHKKRSDLSRMNRDAGERWVSIAPELFAVMQESQHVSELSGGAFDVTFASVGRYYEFRDRKRPNRATIEATLEAINYRNIQLNEANQEVRFAHPAVYVDLGGIAKGFAVDRAIARLESLGITDAVVTAGGDTRLIGDRHGRPWIVGVKNPRSEDDMAVVLPLERTAISTSGDYERYFEEDGVRYHHILDPQTGDSARKVRSVSVLGPEATRTDALSTTVFVLGVAQGLALIESLPGYEAIIIDGHGALHYSSDFEALSPSHSKAETPLQVSQHAPR